MFMDVWNINIAKISLFQSKAIKMHRLIYNTLLLFIRKLTFITKIKSTSSIAGSFNEKWYFLQQKNSEQSELKPYGANVVGIYNFFPIYELIHKYQSLNITYHKII